MLLIFISAVLIVSTIFLRAFFESRLRNYVFGKTGLDEVVALRSDTSTGGLFKVYFVNLLLVVFSFGLVIPLAKVRLARYTANTPRQSYRGI